MENVLISWSGGKDSAIALYEILKNQNYQNIHLAHLEKSWGGARIWIECAFHATPVIGG